MRVSRRVLPQGPGRRNRPALTIFAGLLILASAACGPRRLALPSGTGQPFPAFEAAFDEATRPCRAIDTMTAELGVSGRVGGHRLRGRVLAGFSRPASLRLEGLAPFGPPAFILVSSEGRATLLLPRDRAVLEGEPPEAIIDALVGLPLTPGTLHAILAGCGLAASDAVGGFTFGGGWARIEGTGGDSTWLRQDDSGRWSVAAAVAGSLRVEYEGRGTGVPQQVLLELVGAEPPTELRLRVTGADLNVALGDEAFTIDVPERATTITLGELRRAGPLGR